MNDEPQATTFRCRHGGYCPPLRVVVATSAAGKVYLQPEVRLTAPYAITASYSEEDGCYVAHVEGVPGCAAHGDTPEEAIAEAHTALQGVLAIYKKQGRPLPSMKIEITYLTDPDLPEPFVIERDLADQPLQTTAGSVLKAVLDEVYDARDSDFTLPELAYDSLNPREIEPGVLEIRLANDGYIRWREIS